MSKFFRVCLTVATVAVIGLSTGCGKKAKINLAGLDENKAGSMSENGKGGNNDVAGLVPLAPGGDGAGDASLMDPNAAAQGGWGATASGITDSSNLVKNGIYWNEKLYFDFNRYEVRPSERSKLDTLANHLNANPSKRVVIEGHCDERGSDEYNRSLSERRSLSVKSYLQTLGISESRLLTVSYGEDKPAVPNAQNESDHQKNRRAEFLIGD